MGSRASSIGEENIQPRHRTSHEEKSKSALGKDAVCVVSAVFFAVLLAGGVAIAISHPGSWIMVAGAGMAVAAGMGFVASVIAGFVLWHNGNKENKEKVETKQTSRDEGPEESDEERETRKTQNRNESEPVRKKHRKKRKKRTEEASEVGPASRTEKKNAKLGSKPYFSATDSERQVHLDVREGFIPAACLRRKGDYRNWLNREAKKRSSPNRMELLKTTVYPHTKRPQDEKIHYATATMKKGAFRKILTKRFTGREDWDVRHERDWFDFGRSDTTNVRHNCVVFGNSKHFGGDSFKSNAQEEKIFASMPKAMHLHYLASKNGEKLQPAFKTKSGTLEPRPYFIFDCKEETSIPDHLDSKGLAKAKAGTIASQLQPGANRPLTLVGIAAPNVQGGKYTKSDLTYTLKAAYIAFNGVKIAEAEASEDEKKPYVIDSGNWGCGSFGGDKKAMYILQITAAKMAGVRLVIHSKEKGDHQLFNDCCEIVDSFAKPQDAIEYILKDQRRGKTKEVD